MQNLLRNLDDATVIPVRRTFATAGTRHGEYNADRLRTGWVFAVPATVFDGRCTS